MTTCPKCNEEAVLIERDKHIVNAVGDYNTVEYHCLNPKCDILAFVMRVKKGKQK